MSTFNLAVPLEKVQHQIAMTIVLLNEYESSQMLDRNLSFDNATVLDDVKSLLRLALDKTGRLYE